MAGFSFASCNQLNAADSITVTTVPLSCTSDKLSSHLQSKAGFYMLYMSLIMRKLIVN
jgi:hypothetical protein